MSVPEIDTSVFLFLHTEFRNSFFDIAMPFITRYSGVLFIPLILCAFVQEKSRTWLYFLIAVCTLVLSEGSVHILKEVFARQRPCVTIENIHLVVSCGDSFSMPSGHASNALAFATVYCLLLKSAIRYAFLFVAAVVGFSRVYVGVHYPSDVLAGFLLGAGIAFLMFRICKKEVLGS